MGIMNRILENVESIKSSLSDIKEAANNKGADIRDNDYLDAWADKINSIISGGAQWIGQGNPQQPFGVWSDTLELPIADKDGNAFNTSLNVDTASMIPLMLRWGCREFVVPAYYTTVHINNLLGNSTSTQGTVEKLNIKCSAMTNATYIGHIASMTELLLEEMTDVPNIEMNCHGQTKYKFSAPKCTSLRAWGCSGTTATLVEFNLPNLETLYASSIPTPYFKYCYGTFEFPKLKLIRPDSYGSTSSFEEYTGSTYPQIYKLPALESINTVARFGVASSVKNELWIGPNLATLDSTCATRWATAISGGKLEIHIPAGDSTTKTTLDGKSITYIQDYVIS